MRTTAAAHPRAGPLRARQSQMIRAHPIGRQVKKKIFEVHGWPASAAIGTSFRCRRRSSQSFRRRSRGEPVNRHCSHRSAQKSLALTRVIQTNASLSRQINGVPYSVVLCNRYKNEMDAEIRSDRGKQSCGASSVSGFRTGDAMSKLRRSRAEPYCIIHRFKGRMRRPWIVQWIFGPPYASWTN